MAKAAAGSLVNVEVGQVWKDNDRRNKDRWLVVKHIEFGIMSRTATCAVYYVTEADRGQERPPTYWKEVRRVKIRLDRFRPTSTGYRLVSAIGADS